MSMFVKNIPQEVVSRIDHLVMRVLAEKGVKFGCESSLEIFRRHGFKTDGQIVYFQEKEVRRALEMAPKHFQVRGRDRQYDVTVGAGAPVFCPAYGPVFTLKGNQRAEGSREDLVNFIKLVQTSDVINMSTPYVITPMDVPGDKVLMYQLATVLKYGSKPTMSASGGYAVCREALDLIKKVYRADDGEYVALGLASALSPLSFDETMAGCIRAFAEAGQPVILGCGAMPGATAPITMQGLMVTATAELLAGITLAQLIRPGLPVVFGNVSASTDMRFVTPSIGSPEAGQIAALSKAMCEFYAIPCRGGGTLSDSKETDYAAGSESAMVMLATLASGMDFIIHACGILDSFNIIGYEKFLLDEQTIKAARHMLTDLSLDDQTFGFEAIMSIDHGGQYLAAAHTVKHVRKTLFVPGLSLHGYYDAWVKTGRKTLAEQAGEAVHKRLAAYVQPPLEPEASALVEKYLNC